MKLVMLLLVRDEADIVAQNVAFHLEQGVDHVIATNNGSTDCTRDLLVHFERQGVLTLLDEPGRDHSQWRWMTRMSALARESLGADWLLPNDADEFWWNSGESLKAAITRESEGLDLLHCRRWNMLCSHERLDEERWSTNLRYRVASPFPATPLSDPLRERRPHPHYYYDLPGKVLLRAQGLRLIHQGNHAADYHSPAREGRSAIRIYHYPVRSHGQFELKVRHGGLAYSRNSDLPEEAGWHKRRWFDLLRREGLKAALADGLPSTQRLEADLASGTVVEDLTLARTLRTFSDRLVVPAAGS